MYNSFSAILLGITIGGSYKAIGCYIVEQMVNVSGILKPRSLAKSSLVLIGLIYSLSYP